MDDEPLLGGYEDLPLEAAEKIHTFIHNKLKIRPELELTKYERQVVAGFNHILTYIFKDKSARVHVFEDMDGEYSQPIILGR